MSSSSKKRLVLLDAHAIIHRAYHALPDFVSSKGEPTGALYGISAMIIKIIDDLKPDYIVACLDEAGPTYRHEIYKEYKALRKKTDDALVMQIIRSRDVFKAFGIPMYSVSGFEADDILATIVEQIKDKKDFSIIIASGDMDALQLVDGKKIQVYTLKKGIKDTIMYDEDGVVARFGFSPKLIPDYKGLRGDASDNIKGIKGIGDKTATTLIQNFGSIENLYKSLQKEKAAFEKAGIKARIIDLLVNGREDAEFSKTLATMRRDAPIKFEIPEKKWMDSVEIEKAIELFRELEFRTLGERLKELVLGKETMSLLSATSHNDPDIDQKELRKCSIALWLLDSNITDPNLGDILNFSRTNSFSEGRKVLLSEIEKRGLTKVYNEIELPLIPIVDAMKQRGIKIDSLFLKKMSAENHKILSKLESDIWKEAGEQFNINSPKQLGNIIFDKLLLSLKHHKKTTTGVKSTRESELEKLKDTHVIIPLILKYRELQKLLSTYIDNIPQMVDDVGRLHARFIQTGSTTGRMASKDPNLQNIPIKGEFGKKIRNAFVTDKGMKLVAIDYSQIELRIAAFLSKDPKLIEIFKGGDDVHTAVASEVFKVSKDEVTADMRRQAKVINFGIIYGMGVNSLRENLGTDRETAQKFYNAYFERFSGLAKYLDEIKSTVERQGYTETYFGRRRYFEGINSSLPYIKSMAERMAINAPIQGTGADILKLAMVRVYEYIREQKLSDKVFILLQVHDELVFEINEKVLDSVLPDIKKIMENVIPAEKIYGVVCKVECKVGDNWGEMEKQEL